MISPQIIQRALAMPPDRIGAGRLCQELLAEVTGMPITHRPEPLVPLVGTQMIGNRNGRGRPRRSKQ